MSKNQDNKFTKILLNTENNSYFYFADFPGQSPEIIELANCHFELIGRCKAKSIANENETIILECHRCKCPNDAITYYFFKNVNKNLIEYEGINENLFIDTEFYNQLTKLEK